MPKSGIYSKPTASYPLSADRTANAEVDILDCGCAIISPAALKGRKFILCIRCTKGASASKIDASMSRFYEEGNPKAKEALSKWAESRKGSGKPKTAAPPAEQQPAISTALADIVTVLKGLSARMGDVDKRLTEIEEAKTAPSPDLKVVT